MYTWTKTDNSFCFELTCENNYYNNDRQNIDCQRSIPYIILNELIENGLADKIGNKIFVPDEEICNLDSIDKKIIGLPDLFPFDLYIYCEGTLNQQDVKIKYGFYVFAPHGEKMFFDRKGNLVESLQGDFKYLLSLDQYKLCNAIDEFNKLSIVEKTFDNNLRNFNSIKSLSKPAQVVFDTYLENENVFIPEKIGMDIKRENDTTFTIVPTMDGIDNEKFLNSFEKYPDAKDSYSIQDINGNRTRIILNKEQQIECRKIRKNFYKINDKDLLAKLVESPEEIFDSDIIDYSVLYSDRVVDIGLYKPKFYSFICPYKSKWIPGIEIKKGPNDKKSILIKEEKDILDLEGKIRQAENENSEFVNIKGEIIPIDKAKELLVLSKRNIDNSESEIKDSVLIIKENIEYTEYSETLPEIKSTEHRYYSVNNMNQEINIKEHQKEGIAWFQMLWKQKISGGLLADDMGLGKTIQSLIFIEWHFQNSVKSSNKPYLIVCPLSLIENWQREYDKFFLNHSLQIYSIRKKLCGSKDETIREIQKNTNLVIVSYETFKSNQLYLCAIDWAVVILDEAQKIKTPGTIVTNACKSIKSDFKIALTGTPVENTLLDLWCIMDFISPGFLGSAKEFAKKYQNPLRDCDIDIIKIGEEVRNSIGYFFKRRLKKDVLQDLPHIHEIKEKVLMPPIQNDIYCNIVESFSSINTENRRHILSVINELKIVSDHPYLLNDQISCFSTNELINTSAKLMSLVRILEEIRKKDEKVIVFCERKDAQIMLSRIISDKFSINISIINGDTPVNLGRDKKTKESRQMTIDRFENKQGFNVLIMSQLAAGIGLNIVGANNVIHFSRHWNPSKEEQATARVYRIGQQREVFVYYPQSYSDQFTTFDIILDNLLDKKKQLANSTLFPTEKIEVFPEDIYSGVIGETTFSSGPHNTKFLDINEIDRLKPDKFESSISALYRKKMGGNVLLTPISNDKGVDIIIFSENDNNLLIQVKQTQDVATANAIQEILRGERYYSTKYSKNFQLIILTNREFSVSAKEEALNYKIKVVERQKIEKMLIKYPITHIDILNEELNRLR